MFFIEVFREIVEICASVSLCVRVCMCLCVREGEEVVVYKSHARPSTASLTPITPRKHTIPCLISVLPYSSPPPLPRPVTCTFLSQTALKPTSQASSRLNPSPRCSSSPLILSLLTSIASSSSSFPHVPAACLSCGRSSNTPRNIFFLFLLPASARPLHSSIGVVIPSLSRFVGRLFFIVSELFKRLPR